MLKSLYVCATTAALALSASSGHAMSINIGAGVKPALDATDVIQKAAKGAFTLATLRALGDSDAGKVEAALKELEHMAVAR